MHAKKNQKAIPITVMLLGAMGLALRMALDAFFQDEKGLNPAFHPLTLAVLGLMAAAFVLAFFGARTIEEAEGYDKNFPASLAGCLGHFLAAVGLGATALLTSPALAGSLTLVWKVLAFAGVPCLLAAGVCRLRGRQPYFLLHLVPSLFLLIHAVSNYRAWSSEPQITNYLFSLLAILALMLFSFYHSAFDTGLEWRRKLTFFAYVSVSLSLTAVPGSDYPWLYLGCALWALLDRPIPKLRRRRPRPFQEETA